MTPEVGSDTINLSCPFMSVTGQNMLEKNRPAAGGKKVLRAAGRTRRENNAGTI